MPTIIRFIFFVVLMPLASVLITNIVMKPLAARSDAKLMQHYAQHGRHN